MVGASTNDSTRFPMPELSKALLAFLLWCVAVAAHAGPVEQLRDFQRNVQDFEATFEQDVVGPEGGVLQQSSGDVWLQRPDRFRWDYRKPYPQVIVGDGSKVWVYDTELEQVTVKDLDRAVGNAPALVLSGGGDLSEHFETRELPPHDGLQWVELRPLESEADFKTVEVGFGDTLQRMILHDNFGQTTRIRFDNVRLNQQPDPERFRFQVPDGVDVVGDLR